MKTFEIHKFGGASTKDAVGIHNVFSIIQSIQTPRIVVFSAMGKITNALENLTQSLYNNKQQDAIEQWNNICLYYQNISTKLHINFTLPTNLPQNYLNKHYNNYNQLYDEIVSQGEIFSTQLITDFFTTKHYNFNLIDITKILITDEHYREAQIDIPTSYQNLINYIAQYPSDLYITQGFIGGTKNGIRTTLGRESSDYTATLLASFVNATQVTIWKDVNGVYDSDPKHNDKPILFTDLTYQKAEELALAGAQIIHPKTISPLKNKKIPLYVKPFLQPTATGTLIH